MKFIEPDFARAANLFLSFEENDIEILSTEEIEKFHFLLYHFLCRIAYKTGTIYLDRKTKIIKIKLQGYKKNDIYVINFDPTSDCGYFLSSIISYDSDDKSQDNAIIKIKKYLDKFSFELSYDPFGNINFKINFKK